MVYAAAAVLLVAIVGTIASMMMVVARTKCGERTRALLQRGNFTAETRRRAEPVPTQYADQLAAIPGAEGVRHQMLQDGIEFYQRYEKEAADDPALATDWALAQSKLGR